MTDPGCGADKGTVKSNFRRVASFSVHRRIRHLGSVSRAAKKSGESNKKDKILAKIRCHFSRRPKPRFDDDPRPAAMKGHFLKDKIIRFLTSLLPISSRRRGQCIDCGACCRLPTPCMFLGSREDGGSYCRIYSIRPPSCRKYPRTPSEFITQGDCGYWFEAEAEKSPTPVAVVQFYPSRSATDHRSATGLRVSGHASKGPLSLARRAIATALTHTGLVDLRSYLGSKTD